MTSDLQDFTKKPPFSYYGGKQPLAKKIIPLIPKHTVYAEPFCGSASVFFMKPYPNTMKKSDYIEALNDTNHLIINFFKVLKDEIKSYELARDAILTPYSRKFYDEASSFLKEKNE